MSIRSFQILTLAIASLPIGKAQSVLISSYSDDPFVGPSIIKRMDPAEFGQGRDGRPTLYSNRVLVTDEDVIYRKDKAGIFNKFAWNPWWWQAWTNPRWDLTFPDEERFPLFRPLRGSDNQIVLKDGLQVWLPQDLNLGNTTAFEAANAVKDAADLWSGRFVNWGSQCESCAIPHPPGAFLLIETHAFIDFNAFYSPSARELFFGVIPYRLAGHTEVNMFETATSWDMVAHEAGHAVEHGLKLNLHPADPGYHPWGESFGDQTAMWASLRNPERVSRLLAETKGDFNHSNSLSALGEAFAALTGTGTGVRDACQDLKVSDTTEEAHERSQVLTGAAYRLFVAIYGEQRRGLRDEDALSEAGRIMGVFLMQSADYAPENRLVLQDIVKGYLKVDKEIFAGRYNKILVDEFTRRELLDASSLRDWQAHEQALPQLWLPDWSTDADAATFVEQNQDRLGVGQEFGLRLQSVTRLGGAAQGRMIVRVQLTNGRGAEATLLNNHGILVFRANGDLADYHPPVPGDSGDGAGSDESSRSAAAAIGKARQARLHLYGVPLSLVRKPDGSLSAEAHVLRGEGINTHMVVFTPENPGGERREILKSPLSPGQRQAIANILAQ
jgi:hypothetical protein